MMTMTNEDVTMSHDMIMQEEEVEQGPRAQHLHQAFRKSLSSTIKRTT